MKKKYIVGAQIAGIVILFGLFYVLNYMTPMYADDYSYSASFVTGQKITSFGELLESQYRHYFVLNGRIVSHTIAQMFLILGDSIFNILNTIGFLGLVTLIYYHSFGKIINFQFRWFVSIYLGLWFITPYFGQSFLWIVGASNYLYGILIILIFLIPYRKYMLNDGIKEVGIWKQILQSIVMFAGGVIAGWTNENTSVALFVMIMLIIIYFKWLKKPLRVWLFTGWLGSLLGMLGMLFSPSQQARLENNGGTGGLLMMIRRGILITKDLFIYFLPLFIVLAVFLILLFKLKKEKALIIKELLIPGIYLVGCMASVYSMVVAPSFPERTWSGPVVLAIIVLGTLYSKLDYKNNDFKVQYSVCLGILLIGFCASFLDAYLDLKSTYVKNQERNRIIENAKLTGETEIELESILSDNKYNCFTYIELAEDPAEWPNDDMANYFGLSKISMKE